MAFKTAQASRVAVGLLNASGYTKGYSLTAQTIALDTTVLTDTAKTFIIGQDESSGSLDMLFDTVGTTVRRYLRVVDDVTGTGSTTRFVSFARR